MLAESYSSNDEKVPHRRSEKKHSARSGRDPPLELTEGLVVRRTLAVGSPGKIIAPVRRDSF